MPFKSGFLNLNTTDIWGRITLCCVCVWRGEGAGVGGQSVATPIKL